MRTRTIGGLIALGAVLLACGGKEPPSLPVSLTATGATAGMRANVVYSGRTGDAIKKQNVNLPFTREQNVRLSVGGVTISVVSESGGTVTCTIRISGIEEAKVTAKRHAYCVYPFPQP